MGRRASAAHVARSRAVDGTDCMDIHAVAGASARRASGKRARWERGTWMWAYCAHGKTSARQPRARERDALRRDTRIMRVRNT